MTSAKNILGVSPGTRMLGIAVLRDGRLAVSKVKTFFAAWSEGKSGHIIRSVERIIEQKAIDAIALKMTHPSRSSHNLDKVVAGIKAIAEQRNIPLTAYSMEELHAQCSFPETRRKSKPTLAAWLLHRYPEMLKVYRKMYSKGQKRYYTWIVEAIAVAHMHYQGK